MYKLNLIQTCCEIYLIYPCSVSRLLPVTEKLTDFVYSPADMNSRAKSVTENMCDVFIVCSAGVGGL